MRPLPSLLSVSLLLFAAACATPQRPGPVTEPGDVIAQHQIDADGSRTVYELVQRLHPLWLQKRGTNTIQDDGDIVVYLDNARLGGPETLREIPAGNAASVRFLDAGRAQYRYGVGHMHGAIVVTTRTR